MRLVLVLNLITLETGQSYPLVSLHTKESDCLQTSTGWALCYYPHRNWTDWIHTKACYTHNFPFTREISYPCALFAANLNSLHFRRYDISKSFFQDICDPSSCIRHLFPPPRDNSVLFRLRTVTPLPRLSFRNEKHCFFI